MDLLQSLSLLDCLRLKDEGYTKDDGNDQNPPIQFRNVKQMRLLLLSTHILDLHILENALTLKTTKSDREVGRYGDSKDSHCTHIADLHGANHNKTR